MKEIVSDEAVLGGTPRLDGTRIGVVHNALAFVFDNPALLRNQETVEEEAIERIRERRPVDPGEFKPQI